MDTKIDKKIDYLPSNEVIHHHGNLTIESDVGEHAQIRITDGSLIILGKILDGAQIQVHVREELRNTHLPPMMHAPAEISHLFGSVGRVSVGRITSCNFSVNMGNKRLMQGNVNINNRIFTNDTVIEHGSENYTVMSTGSDPMRFLLGNNKITPQGIASVKVDGITYSGKEITIKGQDVYVDGLVTESKPVKPQEPPKLIVYGAVGNNVSIQSDIDINLKENTGNFCQFKSDHAGLNAKNIGLETLVHVRNEIYVKNIGNASRLTSQLNALDADHIGSHVTINVRNAINIKGDIGNSCAITSQQYGLTAKNVGEHVQISTREAIKVGHIKTGSVLTSAQYGLTAGNIGSQVKITTRDAISVEDIADGATLTTTYKELTAGMVGKNVTIVAHDQIKVRDIGDDSSLTSKHNAINARNIGNSVTLLCRDALFVNRTGNTCILKSNHNAVEINEQIGSHTNLNARDSITLGDSSNYCSISSTHDRVKIFGNAGENNTISAKNAISANNIGTNSILSCSHGSINVRNIGPHVNITAKGDIDVDGTWHQNTRVISKKGKVRKNPDNLIDHIPLQAKPDPYPTPQDEYYRGLHDSDMQHAIQISQVAILQKTGMFAQQKPVPQMLKLNDVPDSFLCPITQEIMEDPVFLTLDNRTYERNAISTWLEKNRNAPMSRKPMESNQTIEQVLFPNLNLKNAIEAYNQQKDHPENKLAS